MLFATDQLFQAILKAPDEWDRYLVFADQLEEEGDYALALTFRWMGSRKKRPHQRTRYPSTFDRQGAMVPQKYKYAWHVEPTEFQKSNGHQPRRLRDVLEHAILPRLVFWSMGHSIKEHSYLPSTLDAIRELSVGLTRLKEALTP